MKLFISYSREDAGDFARHVHRYLMNSGHDVFIDVNSIKIGDPWAHSIEQNISNCDIFLVILTPDSLRSNYVENEILQAQRENKIIVPCISEDVEYNDIKWGLGKIQGIEFINEYQLTRKLYSKIKSYENRLSDNNDKTSNLNTTESFSIKQDSDTLKESNDTLQPLQPPIDNTYSNPHNKYFKNASKFEGLGLPEKAIEMYDLLIKKEPENFDALFNKSLILGKITQYEKAIECLEHAINIHPDHPNVWYHRGCFLEKIGKYDDAIKSFDTDLRIDPKDITTRKLKSQILEKLGKDEEHLQELDEIIKIDSKDLEMLEKKAILLDKLSRYDEEIDCYDKGLEIEPDNHYILVSKGHLLQKLEKYKEAVECYDKVLNSKPEDIEVRIERCVAISKSHRYQEAVECYDESIQLDPNNKLLYLNKGNILYKNLKQYKEAIKCYDKLLQLDPTDQDSKKNRESALNELEKEKFAHLINEANSYYKKGDYSKVIELCDNKESINNPILQEYKGDSFYMLGNYEKALQCYDKVLEREPSNFKVGSKKNKTYRFMKQLDKDSVKSNAKVLKSSYPEYSSFLESANSLYKIGFALSKQGKYQEAIEYYDQALAVDQNHVFALNNKGFALSKQGKYQEAIEYYDQALAVDQNYVHVLLDRKGNALQNLGKYLEAIDCYDEALRIDPNYTSAKNNKKLALEYLYEEKTLLKDTMRKYSFIKSWGSKGSRNGEFNSLNAIAVDSKGYVYVADSENNSIQKFDSNGRFITKWGNKTGKLLKPGGTFGPGSYMSKFLNSPNVFNHVTFDIKIKLLSHHGMNVAIDSKGYVYVVDSYNNRIQKFDSNGNFIVKWGSEGTGDGEFDNPSGISVDSSTGNVYVIDFANNRIQKFDSNGNFIVKWGSKGTGNAQFLYPSGISVDSSTGNVYVIDTNYIKKFNNIGIFMMQWGKAGIGDGEFDNPLGISVDSSTGNVYISDSYNNRIQKFDSNGRFITKWGNKGTEDGQFDHPLGITVDSKGNVYVADTGNNRIQVFAPITI